MPRIHILTGEIVNSFSGISEGSGLMVFRLASGKVLDFMHYQDCCESVAIEKIVGNPDFLVGHPLEYVDEEIGYSSGTQTTYTFKIVGSPETLKVTWLGESNGHYSEDVTVRIDYHAI